MLKRARTWSLAAAGALALGVIAPFPSQATSHGVAPTQGNVVISQLYGGGGNAGSPQYRNDFLVLFNRSAEPISLANTSVHYASATGTGNFVRYNLPSFTLEPGQRFLIQGGTGGSGTGDPLPTPDATIGANLHHQAGKVVLATGTAALDCTNTEQATTCSTAAQQRFLDVLGYGNATYFEGTGAAATLTITTAAFRNGAGCEDTNNNRADFHTAAPLARNSTITPAACVAPQEPALPPAPVVAPPTDAPAPEPAPALEEIPTTPEELAAIEPAPAEVALTERVENIVERIEVAETPADVGMIVTELTTVGDQLATVSPTVPEYAALGARHPGCNGIDIAVTKVQPRSTAKKVLEAKHAEWECNG